MKYRNITLVALLVLGASQAHAQSVDTVAWVPDSSADGIGTGTLAGGSIAVGYTTAVGAGNSGTTYPVNWNTSLATAGGVGTGVTHFTGGVIGELASAQTQTITFSATVTNPLLLVNYTDAPSTYNFGAIPIAFLSSHNAQLSGGIVTFTGSNDSVDDGFAARLTGVFGPSNPLVFQSTSTTGASQAFTVGQNIVVATPEPGAYAFMAGLGIAGAGFLRRRKTSCKAL